MGARTLWLSTRRLPTSPFSWETGKADLSPRRIRHLPPPRNPTRMPWWWEILSAMASLHSSPTAGETARFSSSRAGHGNLLLPGKSFDADLRSDAGVRAADFNHDGHLDIVTTSERNNSVGLLLGDGKGGFKRSPSSPFTAAPVSWSFAVGDVDGDGNPDVIVMPYQRELADAKQLGLTVLLGDGKGGFGTMRGSPFSLAGCEGPARIASGDVNGDGVTDLAVSCAQNDRVLFFLGERGGGFRTSSRSVPTGWSGLAIADLHRDGRNEVLVSNYARNTITILAGTK